MQRFVLNKKGKFGVKILWRYTDMAIFVLRCFILTHPVLCRPLSWRPGASSPAASSLRQYIFFSAFKTDEVQGPLRATITH